MNKFLFAIIGTFGVLMAVWGIANYSRHADCVPREDFDKALWLIESKNDQIGEMQKLLSQPDTVSRISNDTVLLTIKFKVAPGSNHYRIKPASVIGLRNKHADND
jgi:hypothetical protein